MWPKTRKIYVRKDKDATIAQWICLYLPTCWPVFCSQAHHLHFYHLHLNLCYICLCIVKRAKINKKETRFGPFLKIGRRQRGRNWGELKVWGEKKKFSRTFLKRKSSQNLRWAAARCLGLASKFSAFKSRQNFRPWTENTPFIRSSIWAYLKFHWVRFNQKLKICW